jgi:hypothetical protein
MDLGDAPVFMCFALHHVTCRGIERRWIFWEDSDRDDFLKRLEAILIETPTPCEQILKPGKQPTRDYARSLLCHLAIRRLGMTAMAVSKLLGISQSAATREAYRGEAITAADNLTLVEGHNA